MKTRFLSAALAAMLVPAAATAAPGFVKAVFTGSDLDTTSDPWTAAGPVTVLRADEFYAGNAGLGNKTTVAAGTYMHLTAGVTNLFKGVYDDYVYAKLGSVEILPKYLSLKEVAAEVVVPETGWYKLDLRVSNVSGNSGCNYVQQSLGFGFGGLYYSADGGETWNEFADPGDGSLFRTDEPASDLKGDPSSVIRFVGDSPNAITLVTPAPDCEEFELPGTAFIAGGRRYVLNGGVFAGCPSLATLTIPEPVHNLTVDSQTFSGCTNLTTVHLPGTLTNIVERNRWGVFPSCVTNVFADDLSTYATYQGQWFFDTSKSVERTVYVNGTQLAGALAIPEGTTTIGRGAFCGCAALTSVSIPGTVESIGYSAFRDCSGLLRADIESGVQTVWQDAFSGCYDLTTVSIPATLTNPGDNGTWTAFPNTVTDIYIENLGVYANTQARRFSVNISQPLARRIYLNGRLLAGDVSIPSGTAQIWSCAFLGCSGIQTLTIPGSVESIGSGAFRNCYGLIRVDIESGVQKIGQDAFMGCYHLTTVSIPATMTNPGDNSSGTAFPNSVTDIYIENLGVYAGNQARRFSVDTSQAIVRRIYLNGRLLDGDLEIPSGTAQIRSCAFLGCSDIQTVTVPGTVESIGDSSFRNCTGLKSATLSEGVTSIGSFAFYGCSGLTDVTIPEGVTSIAIGLFSGCSGLTSVTIPEGVKSIGNNAFQNCSGLTSVSIPESVTSIGQNAFSGCSGLTSVTIPENVTSIGNNAFQNCSGLTSVTIPEGVTSIGSSTFYGCSGLTSVTIPESVTSIGHGAFYCCSGLTSVTIPEGVTRIEGNAFYACSGLKYIIFPESLATISDWSFHGVSPTHVEFRGGVPDGIGNLYLSATSCRYVFPEEYGAEWNRYFASRNGTVMNYDRPDVAQVEILSAQMRENDPTIMDVVYKAVSSNDTVSVRALAFEDGERSFAKIVRPETFVDGTGTNLGDDVAANVEHTVSWRVSADWNVDLAKVSFEILVSDQGQLPMELVTIPAAAGHETMTVNVRTPTPSLVFDALLWHYAAHAPDLTVSDGELLYSDTLLAKDDGLANSTLPISYVYDKMGFDLLDGNELEYARSATRWPLKTTGFTLNSSPGLVLWKSRTYWSSGVQKTEWIRETNQNTQLAFIQYAVKREAGE